MVKPRPVADPAGLTSEAALDRYETDLELWGEDGWLQVARLCRFFDEVGMPNLDCPPPPEATPPDPGQIKPPSRTTRLDGRLTSR